MKAASLVAVPILTVGCVAQNDPRLRAAEDTKQSVTAMEERVEILEEALSRLNLDVIRLKRESNPYETAVFDPGEPGGYGRIDTTGGTFLVSLKNVTPYLDGFRLTCQFGNPSSADFKGFTLKAKWGARMDVDKYAEWRRSLQEKELTLTESLKAGAWNSVSFVLTPAKADEFGYLELSMRTDTVSLRE